MGLVRQWATTPGPYRRTALLVAGLAVFVPAELLLNALVELQRFGPQTPTGEPAMHGYVGIGLVMIPLTVGALLLAAGLTCLGAAVPAADRRPFLTIPAGAFDAQQRVLFAFGGVVMLAGLVAGLGIGIVLFPLAALLAYNVLPTVALAGYLLVVALLVVPLDDGDRALGWAGSAGLAFLVAGIGIWALSSVLDGRVFVFETLAGGLPVIAVLAGYVARLPVVTYISRD